MSSKETGYPALKWIFWILGMVVFMFAIVSTINSCKKNTGTGSDNNSEKSETKQKNSVVNYTYEMITYTGEYGDFVNIPTASMAAFLESTEPYCAKNANGVEFCGEAGEDISTKFGDDIANSRIKFKSTNGKGGTLKLRKRDKTIDELNP